jgi:hypothetical protein
LFLVQRKYREHLRDKRFIERRKPITAEMLKWANDLKQLTIRNKIKREKSILDRAKM